MHILTLTLIKLSNLVKPLPLLTLILYVLAAVLACLLAELAIARREQRTPGFAPGQLQDPYAIAYLRGGVAALLDVVALSLRRRGLLTLDEPGQADQPRQVKQRQLRTLDSSTGADALPPIEAAVLKACRLPRPAAQLEWVPQVLDCAAVYQQALAGQRLLAGPDVRAARRAPCGIAIAVVVLTGAALIALAWPAGPGDILLLLPCVLCAVMYLASRMRDARTRRGRQALAQLRILFARVKPGRARLSSSSALPEIALLAAVYGVNDPRAGTRADPVASDAVADTDQALPDHGSCGGCG